MIIRCSVLILQVHALILVELLEFCFELTCWGKSYMINVLMFVLCQQWICDIGLNQWDRS